MDSTRRHILQTLGLTIAASPLVPLCSGARTADAQTTCVETASDTEDVPGMPSGAAVATTVNASGPIVAERSMYWPGNAWYEGHNGFGLTETGTKWAFGEGRVGGSSAYQTYILLANPGAAAANVTVRG